MTRLTFPQQLRMMQALLALLMALSAACLALMLAAYTVAAVLVVVAVVASMGWLLHAEWRLFARQRTLAELAQRLRQISQTLPSGMARLYANSSAGMAVHCSPGGIYDQFSIIEGDDIIDIDRADPGDVIRLPTTTYRIRRSMPLVWRHVWADEAVKGSNGQFHHGARPTNSVRAIVRAFLLNHRTGLLTPDREELAEVLRLIQSADRTWDLPGSTS